MVRKLSTRRKYNEYYTNYLVEDEVDLKTIVKSNMGDVAFVIHTSEHWMCDNNHTWYNINSSNKGPIECDCIDEMTIWEDLQE